MPSQMLAMVTESSAVSGDVSQLICSAPNAPSTELTMPLSLLSIHAHVDAETMSGSSHGTRNIARSTPDSRNPDRKNTASARPIAYWNTIETTVKTAVFQRAIGNVAELNTSAYFSNPTNSALPWTNWRIV